MPPAGLEREKIVHRLAAADDARLPAAHENGGRPWHRVVVRAHRERVRTGCRNGEEVAARGEAAVDVVDEHVSRLAVKAGDAHRLRGGSSARAAEVAVYRAP